MLAAIQRRLSSKCSYVLFSSSFSDWLKDDVTPLGGDIQPGRCRGWNSSATCWTIQGRPPRAAVGVMLAAELCARPFDDNPPPQSFLPLLWFGPILHTRLRTKQKQLRNPARGQPLRRSRPIAEGNANLLAEDPSKRRDAEEAAAWVRRQKRPVRLYHRSKGSCSSKSRPE